MEKETITILGILEFDPSITFGNLLTIVTLVCGFLWWSYNYMKKLREDSKDFERRGLNRLLLKILREHGVGIETDELF